MPRPVLGGRLRAYRDRNPVETAGRGLTVEGEVAAQIGPTNQAQQETHVAMYLDIHDIPGVKAGDVVGAHAADVRVQAQYGVNYKYYWVDEEAGKVFCLVEAPDRESAIRVHREAHGLVADALHEVEQGA
jgi:Protein of unknown function (DUF4242)